MTHTTTAPDWTPGQQALHHGNVVTLGLWSTASNHTADSFDFPYVGAGLSWTAPNGHRVVITRGDFTFVVTIRTSGPDAYTRGWETEVEARADARAQAEAILAAQPNADVVPLRPTVNTSQLAA